MVCKGKLFEAVCICQSTQIFLQHHAAADLFFRGISMDFQDFARMNHLLSMLFLQFHRQSAQDELAVGLQPISRHCAFLLGRGARPWGPESGDFKSQWSNWWSAEIEDSQDAAAEMNGWDKWFPVDPTNHP